MKTPAKVICRTCKKEIAINEAMIKITGYIILCDTCYQKYGGFHNFTNPQNLLTAGQNTPATAPERHQTRPEAVQGTQAPRNTAPELADIFNQKVSIFVIGR